MRKKKKKKKKARRASRTDKFCAAAYASAPAKRTVGSGTPPVSFNS